MKILIGYDGSNSAEAALDDLETAGFPDDVEASVISVAEVWMPPSLPKIGDKHEDDFLITKSEWFKLHNKVAKNALTESEILVQKAKEKLQLKFPKWKVGCEARYGSPASEILALAEDFKPDLIVVGSQGKTAISRILLGSISKKVLAEAKCSVRIARERTLDNSFPTRIIIGFDGSSGSITTIDAVVSRKWSEYSEVRLISSTNSMIPLSIERFVPAVGNLFEDEIKTEQIWVEKLAESVLRKLNDAGLQTEICAKVGNPKQVLIEEADNWSADCIFVGSYSFNNKPENFLLGCTSAAVAERAHCSVEVIRA